MAGVVALVSPQSNPVLLDLDALDHCIVVVVAVVFVLNILHKVPCFPLSRECLDDGLLSVAIKTSIMQENDRCADKVRIDDTCHGEYLSLAIPLDNLSITPLTGQRNNFLELFLERF